MGDFESELLRWEPWLGALTAVVDPPLSLEVPDGLLSGWDTGAKAVMAVRGQPHPHGADRSPSLETATAILRMVASGASFRAMLNPYPLRFVRHDGEARNPRWPDLRCGGSSSGSAAAVAAGLLRVALGGDTGGSVRAPAACCGVVALKPTNGFVPMTGAEPIAWSLDVIGPMARNVPDCAQLLAAVAGFDPSDPLSYPDGPSEAGILDSIRRQDRLRVGIPTSVGDVAIDPAAADEIVRLAGTLEAEGHSVSGLNLDWIDEATDYSTVIQIAEASVVHRSELETAPIDPSLSRVGASNATDLAEAQRFRLHRRRALRQDFDRVDVVLLPTLNSSVARAGASPDPAVTRFLPVWNYMENPAGSVPTNVHPQGGPMSVQVIGERGKDDVVLHAMATIERISPVPWAATRPEPKPGVSS